jgi:hypothetical protein
MPGRGGHEWVFLQYLLGFKGLGYEPLFIDHLTQDMSVDSHGRHSPARRATSVRWLRDVMRRAGLEESYTLLLDDGRETIGLPRRAMLDRVAHSPVLLNVMGFIRDDEVLATARERVFVDIDPGFGQIWRELGLADPFSGHDHFVTIAENIGEPGCGIPTCGLDWLTTRQPVNLDQWPRTDAGARFTTVASWRGPYGPLEFNGRTYGLRAHEFRKFAELPRLTGEPCELALDIDPTDRDDLNVLQSNGWKLVDPCDVAGDGWRYRQYIQRSKAEVMVAKGLYVQTHSGWFSDRSTCYLASGKPVLAQDTGFATNYPVGEGLFAFSDLDEAVGGVEEIRGNLERHSSSARALAEEHFEARKVLGRLLSQLGVS